MSRSRQALARPSISRRELARAARLYQGFRERDVGRITRARLEDPRVAVHIGKVRAIEYETTHGEKGVLYRHAFASWARPELLVTPNGRQLLILPGNYSFTARGIVDRRRR